MTSVPCSQGMHQPRQGSCYRNLKFELVHINSFGPTLYYIETVPNVFPHQFSWCFGFQATWKCWLDGRLQLRRGSIPRTSVCTLDSLVYIKHCEPLPVTFWSSGWQYLKWFTVEVWELKKKISRGLAACIFPEVLQPVGQRRVLGWHSLSHAGQTKSVTRE